MATGTIDFTQSATSGSYIDGKIVWTSTVVDVTKRWSSLNVKLYVRKGSTDTTLTIPTEGTWSYNLTINGQTYTGTNKKSVLKDWVEVISYTIPTVLHDYDGSKSVVISGSVTAPAGTSFAGHTSSGSGTAKLDTIPQATTIDSLTCSSTYVDGTITALYTPKSSAYYNRCIAQVYGSNAWVTIYTRDLGQQSASQQTYTLKFDADKLSTIYSTVTRSTVQIRVVFQTYYYSSYSTKIGNDQSLTLTLSFPASATPTAALTVTPVNTSSWIASKNIYVAGLSGVTATLAATPGAGASLTKANIIYNGTAYSAGKLNITTLNKSGSIEFVAQVTNSRGQFVGDSKTINVLPYFVPTIRTLTVERGTYKSSWTADDNGPDVRVYFIASLALTDYANTYSVTFTLDGNTVTPDTGNPTGLRHGIDYALHFLNVDGDRSHTLTVSFTDLAGQSKSATIIIPTTQVTMDFNDSGKGIAFGKASEKDAFECAMDAEFTGDVTIGGKKVDVVVEEGEKDFWTYRKWSSGLLECWGITTAVTLSFDGTVGLGCWYGTTAPEFKFPTNASGVSMFIDVPTVHQTCDAGSAIIVSSITHVDSEIVKITYGRFYGGNDDKEVEFHFFAKGRWK